MRFPLIACFACLLGSAAGAQEWTHEYVVGVNADQITSCNAEIEFSDGLIALRIYGEEMDIFFSQFSISVPPATELGNVALSFKADTFVASAFSVSSDEPSTSSMFFTPDKADYSNFLSGMRNGSILRITFPDSSFFDIPLDRSNEALEAAGECWQSKPTGPAGKNPFIGTTGRNPFN